MRQWGKPSDAGWDNRSTRPPTPTTHALMHRSVRRCRDQTNTATRHLERGTRPADRLGQRLGQERDSQQGDDAAFAVGSSWRPRSVSCYRSTGQGRDRRAGERAYYRQERGCRAGTFCLPAAVRQGDAESRTTAPEVAPAAKAEPDAASEAAKPETTPSPSPQEEQLSADKARHHPSRQ